MVGLGIERRGEGFLNKENSKVEVTKKRREYEKQLQKSFEDKMRDKYKFEFLSANFKSALAFTADKKVEQNKKLQKN